MSTRTITNELGNEAKGRALAEKYLCDRHGPKGTRLYEECAA